MKFSTVLALAFCVAMVSAAPHRHGRHGDVNQEDNSNHENNSKNIHKTNNQSIGSVGSSGSSDGLLNNLLSGGILSKTTNNNYVSQNAKND